MMEGVINPFNVNIFTQNFQSIQTLKSLGGFYLKKSSLCLLLVIVLSFATILSPTLTYAKENLEVTNDVENIYSEDENVYNEAGNRIEKVYDEAGNLIELEYVDNEEEYRVNTYINGVLVDYSIRIKDVNGNLLDEIYFTKVKEVQDLVENEHYVSFDKTELNFKDISEKVTYNVNDFIESISNEQSNISPSSIPDPYVYIKHKYSSLLDAHGYLYGAKATYPITVEKFHFNIGTALSVIGAAIGAFEPKLSVAVTVLLTSLGITWAYDKITKELHGTYNAYKHTGSYYVLVNGKKTYEHYQYKNEVFYYDSTGKEYTKDETSNWLSEDAILNIGLINA